VIFHLIDLNGPFGCSSLRFIDEEQLNVDQKRRGNVGDALEFY
jgi:hypothetical protein